MNTNEADLSGYFSSWTTDIEDSIAAVPSCGDWVWTVNSEVSEWVSINGEQTIVAKPS